MPQCPLQLEVGIGADGRLACIPCAELWDPIALRQAELELDPATADPEPVLLQAAACGAAMQLGESPPHMHSTVCRGKWLFPYP